jgi:hypothetical protein
MRARTRTPALAMGWSSHISHSERGRGLAAADGLDGPAAPCRPHEPKRTSAQAAAPRVPPRSGVRWPHDGDRVAAGAGGAPRPLGRPRLAAAAAAGVDRRGRGRSATVACAGRCPRTRWPPSAPRSTPASTASRPTSSAPATARSCWSTIRRSGGGASPRPRLAELRAVSPGLTTLDELLELVRAHPGTLLNVELKTLGWSDGGLARAVADALAASGTGRSAARLVVQPPRPPAPAPARARARTAYLWIGRPEVPRLLRHPGRAPCCTSTRCIRPPAGDAGRWRPGSAAGSS